jgi:hypothetical protein
MMPYNRIVTRKQHNRVSGGPAPIHSALFTGTDHLSDGLIPPSARLKAGAEANTALEFYTTSVLREPEMHRQMPGLLFAFAIGYVPRPALGEDSQI